MSKRRKTPREKDIIRQVSRRFVLNENRYWIDASFEMRGDITGKIYFIEKHQTDCFKKDCDGCGTPVVRTKDGVSVLIEIDKDGLKDELSRHNNVVIHDLLLKKSIVMRKKS